MAKDNNVIDHFIRDCNGKNIPASFEELCKLGKEFQRVAQDLSRIEVKFESTEPIFIQLVDEDSNQLNPDVKALLSIPLTFRVEIANFKMERVNSHVSTPTMPSAHRLQPAAIGALGNPQ